VSTPVGLDRLREEVARFGLSPYVITVEEDGRPHAVAAGVGWSGDELTAQVGARTAANAADRPLVSLLWPPSEPGGYSLIVDGAAEIDGDRLLFAPSKAVLHRAKVGGPPPELGACGSDCVPVLKPQR
jgi:hypothetical protein